MSNKIPTGKTSTTSPTRSLRAVSDQDTAAKVRTDNEDTLWVALHADPNSTAAQPLRFGGLTGPETRAQERPSAAKDFTPVEAPGRSTVERAELVL